MTPVIRFALAIVLIAATTTATAQQQPPASGQAARDLVLGKKPAADLVPKGVPRGYALIVGVSDYRNLDEKKDLRFPESDADAVYRVLISQQGGAFPAENVKFLKGPEATLERVRNEIENWLPSVAQPDDRVVVYFAGHGFVENGRGYLAPWDVDPARLSQTAYPMSALGEVLGNKVKAGWKVLLTDACHSGKINAETTNEAMEAQFTSLPSSFLTLTATTEREQSFEDANLSTGYGLFTYYLVQAFQGNSDIDPCDGRITADELIEYVRSNVRGYARARSLSQTPTARGDFDPEMLLGVGSGCMNPDAGGPLPPTMHGTAVIEVNMAGVDVYIDGKLIGTVEPGKPLRVPGLGSGLHEFQGVKSGYEPDRKEIMIAPGRDSTVSIRIRYARQPKKPALDLNEQGEKLLYTRRSSMSLMNLVPMERKQSEDDLRRASGLFERALKEDPTFGLAAYNLGQTHQLLLNYDEAVSYYQKAMTIDPAHIESRTQCAAAMIERGDPDEAIRLLTEAARLDPDNDDLFSMLARAYWDKAAWQLSIDAADRAIALDASNAQAYLWRADSRRQLAAVQSEKNRSRPFWLLAREDYRTFLDLTNFSTSLGSKLAFHFIGMGIGSRRHADRQGAYDSLRSAGFLGLCISEQRVANPMKARTYCERGLKHAPKDPIAHFLLGNVNRDLFNSRPSCDVLKAAKKSYVTMIGINPDLNESANARNYVAQIDGFLPRVCG
jgi:hypothetical protein